MYCLLIFGTDGVAIVLIATQIIALSLPVCNRAMIMIKTSEVLRKSASRRGHASSHLILDLARPPVPFAHQRRNRRHKHGADDERIDQDAGSNREANLEKRLDGRNHHRGESAGQDDAARGDDTACVGAGDADALMRAAAFSLLTHARHQKDIVVGAQGDQQAQRR